MGHAGELKFYRNNGSGVFSYYFTRNVGWNPKYLIGGYLNNDTLLDLVVVNSNQANVSILLEHPQPLCNLF